MGRTGRGGEAEGGSEGDGRAGSLTPCPVLAWLIELHACYAMSGTEVAYNAMQCPARALKESLGGREERERVLVGEVSSYAVSGTDLAYGDTPFLRGGGAEEEGGGEREGGRGGEEASGGEGGGGAGGDEESGRVGEGEGEGG
eukprot:1198347-Rhodomonas_salina.2